MKFLLIFTMNLELFMLITMSLITSCNFTYFPFSHLSNEHTFASLFNMTCPLLCSACLLPIYSTNPLEKPIFDQRYPSNLIIFRKQCTVQQTLLKFFIIQAIITEFQYLICIIFHVNCVLFDKFPQFIQCIPSFSNVINNTHTSSYSDDGKR